jgi:aminopeptidase N
MSRPQTIHLRDYKASPFTVETVDLILDIHADHTAVTATMRVKRHATAGSGFNDLELLGENMDLLGVKLDGRELVPGSYTLSAEKLVVHGIRADEAVVEVRNTIRPHANTALAGFYQSGDILCTQCEPQGFRRITYFIDRPDVMAKYRTTLRADRRTYPLLLSNGNRVSTRELPGGRHEVVWEDPHRKPSYLFAAVAGDLELARDTFRTRSGRPVELEVYVDKGQGHKTGHALRALQESMKWDEDTFGLEYDLDIYMIVAVESFNFGAMENKGLNIFNSAYVLADPTTATDGDFQGVQGVVAHEYFHNWTGNRVTCRDWFQLTLKEGLTVFRDQEFSADMLSRAVKRIEDVHRLKEAQFPEDAGPTAHPIRPSSYIEINNFYTPTVYEKGAEVIRMVHTLIGDTAFKRGITEYFKRHDGQAVTTDDFVAAMESSSGKDLTQFRNWYSRPGTPTLEVRSSYDGATRQYAFTVRQVYPVVGHERLEDNVLHMPFRMALFGPGGERVAERTVELTRMEERFTVDNVSAGVVPSWNRGFAAPVHVDYPYREEELLHLVAYEDDAVSRHEALQQVYTNLLTAWVADLQDSRPLPSELTATVRAALGNIVRDERVDPAFMAHLFEVPSEAEMHQQLPVAAIEEAHTAVNALANLIGVAFRDDWRRLYEKWRDPRAADLSAAAMGGRALKNRALSLWVRSGDPAALVALEAHFYQAQTQTEEASGLGIYCRLGGAVRDRALAHFHQKWKHEPLVMLRWFGAQAAHAAPSEAVATMGRLEKDSAFRGHVPNDLRALYGAFARQNLRAFHAADGSGYAFMAQQIARIDAFNPQVASRLTTVFSLVEKLDENRRALMKRELKKLVDGGPSKDVFEMAATYLG